MKSVIVQIKTLNLKSKGNTFLTAVLLRSEFGADAVHLDGDAGVLCRVPLEGDDVQSAWIPDRINQAVA